MTCDKCCEAIEVDGKKVPGNGACTMCIIQNEYEEQYEVPAIIVELRAVLSKYDTTSDIYIRDISLAVEEVLQEFDPDFLHE